jgi:hypothetical protein
VPEFVRREPGSPMARAAASNQADRALRLRRPRPAARGRTARRPGGSPPCGRVRRRGTAVAARSGGRGSWGCPTPGVSRRPSVTASSTRTRRRSRSKCRTRSAASSDQRIGGARRRPVQSHDQAHGRGPAGAVRAEEPRDGPGRDRGAEGGHGGGAAVALGQLACLDHDRDRRGDGSPGWAVRPAAACGVTRCRDWLPRSPAMRCGAARSRHSAG